jgi:hypothetical protein
MAVNQWISLSHKNDQSALGNKSSSAFIMEASGKTDCCYRFHRYSSHECKTGAVLARAGSFFE